MINLGCDLTDVTESAIFGIVLQKLKIKSDIFSIDQLFEGRYEENLIQKYDK